MQHSYNQLFVIKKFQAIAQGRLQDAALPRHADQSGRGASPRLVMPTAVAEALAPVLSCRPQWPRRSPHIVMPTAVAEAQPRLVMPTAVAEARSAEATERRHLAPLVSSTGMRSVFRPRNPPRRIRAPPRPRGGRGGRGADKGGGGWGGARGAGGGGAPGGGRGPGRPPPPAGAAPRPLRSA
jgi:uncharacterized membrane protein YgcG